jgi:hypothetical protein
MRIQSRAGSFSMTIDEVTTENGELVLIGKMGVWQAKTYLSVEELRKMLAELRIHSSVIDFAVRFAFRSLRELLEAEEERAVPLVLVSGASEPQRAAASVGPAARDRGSA